MSKFEICAAMQACMIYLIMYIVDYSPADEQNARELLLALHVRLNLCFGFPKLTYAGPLPIVQRDDRWMFSSERGAKKGHNLGGLDLC